MRQICRLDGLAEVQISLSGEQKFPITSIRAMKPQKSIKYPMRRDLEYIGGIP